MKRKIITALFLAIISITSIPLFIIACAMRVVTYPFDKRLRLLHQFTCFWGSLYTYIMPAWIITVEGRNKIKNNVPYIIISNHQSQLDILVAFRLYKHYKWVSKSEIFKLPLIGWNMGLNRYVKLIRGDKESVSNMMKDCEMHLHEGSSVYIFPEGTRSHDGKLKEFKLGAFILAKKLNLPILPIVIEGSRFALPKYTIDYFGKHNITLRVLDTIEPAAYKDMNIEELAKHCWSFIHKELAELRIDMYGSEKTDLP